MNIDSQFTTKFHHDRFVSIRSDLGYEIYEVTNKINLFRLKDSDILKKIYSRNEKVKMVEPLYLFHRDLIVVIKQNEGDTLEIKNIYEEKIIFTSKPFSTPVLSLGSTRDKLLVCIETSVFLYSLTNDRSSSGGPHFNHTFEGRINTPYAVTTLSNPNGILAVSNSHYAVPHNSTTGIIKIYAMNNKHSTHTIRAHNEPVSAIALDSSEHFIATTPQSGSVILVYYRYTLTGQPMLTFKIGNSCASISSLSFSKEFTYLACSSDSTIINIYDCSLALLERSWWKYIFSIGQTSQYIATLPKCDMKTCLMLKALNPLKILVATNEGSLKLYSSIRGNETQRQLLLVKDKTLELAMRNENNINME